MFFYRVSLSSNGESLKLGKRPHINGHTTTFVSLIFPVNCVFIINVSSSPGQSTPFLAGVNVILDRCLKFCTRELLIHSMSNSVQGCKHPFTSCFLAVVQLCIIASGLLVTGRSGSGKTSIVQSVAKSIQEDPRTLTCELV